MKTRFAYIISCIVAAAVLSSCDKDYVPEKQITSTFTIKLAVDGSSTTTKTTGSERDEALEEESYISSVRLFSVAANLSSITEITEFEFSPGSSIIEASIPSTCSSGLLYVIANCPDWLTINTDSYSDFVGSYSGQNSNIPDLWADNNFMMVNVQNRATEAGVDKAGIPYDLADGNEAEVRLERLAVKINAAPSESINYRPLWTSVTGNGIVYSVTTMNIDGVALLNCVNSFNLVQQWDKGEGWTADGCAEQILVSPSSNKTYSLTGGYYDTVPSSLVFYPTDKTYYCLENNSPIYDILDDGTTLDFVPGTKMKGRVTALVFRVQAKIASRFDSEVIINEPLYVEEDEHTWTEITTKAGSTDEQARTFFRYKGLCYADASLLPAKAREGVEDLSDYNALRENGVSVYEGGYMYYTYWIEDTNYTDGGKHYLSVMRNTYYDLTVNSIDAFGDDLPCGEYIGTDPILLANPKISVSLKILDWTDVSAHYTL